MENLCQYGKFYGYISFEFFYLFQSLHVSDVGARAERIKIFIIDP